MRKSVVVNSDGFVARVLNDFTISGKFCKVAIAPAELRIIGAILVALLSELLKFAASPIIGTIDTISAPIFAAAFLKAVPFGNAPCLTRFRSAIAPRVVAPTPESSKFPRSPHPGAYPTPKPIKSAATADMSIQSSGVNSSLNFAGS